MRQRLIETSAEQGQPLDVHGRRLIDCYDQLAGILRNRLGQNHAQFLAQPVERSGSITWFTQLPGEVLREDALDAEERQRLKDRAGRIVGDIEGLAADIRTEGATGPMLAEMLRAAAQLAPNASLFSVGGKPVATLWGHHSGASPHGAVRGAGAVPAGSPASTGAARDAVPIGRSGVVPGHAPSAISAQDVAVARNTASMHTRTWIVSALFALLVLVALLWGMRSCSVTPGAPDGPGDLGAQIAEVQARNKALEAEIARRKASAPAVKCVPQTISPAPKAEREPTAPAMKKAAAAARHA